MLSWRRGSSKFTDKIVEKTVCMKNNENAISFLLNLNHNQFINLNDFICSYLAAAKDRQKTAFAMPCRSRLDVVDIVIIAIFASRYFVPTSLRTEYFKPLFSSRRFPSAINSLIFMHHFEGTVMTSNPKISTLSYIIIIYLLLKLLLLLLFYQFIWHYYYCN